MSVMSADMMVIWMEYRAAVTLLEAAERAEAENDDPGLLVAWGLYVGSALAVVQKAYDRLDTARLRENIYWDMQIDAGEIVVLTADCSHHHPALKVGRRLEVYYPAQPDDAGITFRVFDYPTPGADIVLWFPRFYVEGAARRLPSQRVRKTYTIAAPLG